ncbi:unnamed protein product [Ilex paraguariensis]|uniref:RING-type E3 ubiquitin transferase n=1 Tax=Ilex paraguariensis TaxID=185542 RepID=A0ABC8T0G2_9AQUA
MTTQFPDDFKCPISLEIMSDPVILSSGHTFDRSSIQQWLDAGHRTCPITKLPLSEPPSLIPNHALRSLISNYTLVSLPRPQSYPDPQTLIRTLTNPSSPVDSKLNSLDQLSRVSKRDSAVRRRLTESEGVVGRVVAALCGGYAGGDGRAVAATVLTSLAVVEVNKATIGAFPFAIQALVSLLRVGNGRERKESATALYALCSFPENRRRAVDCGAVPILIELVNSGLERAVEVLGLLAKSKEGREGMMRFDGCVEVLATVLKNGTSRGVQYALLTMNSLCCCSEKACLEALKDGVFEICVEKLEDDNEKVRRNAKSLIQVLRGKHSMR